MRAQRRTRRHRSTTSCSLWFERLEEKRLLAADFDIGTGLLTVTGTEQSDKIRVELEGANLVVNCNGVQQTFAAADVTSIRIDALGGNDHILIEDDVVIDALIYGGAGNDRIWGGGGNDTIFGEEGNDRIYGGEGDDSLDGGAGNDRLYGEDGNDTLDGGAGNDRLYGDDGDDTLRGGTGNDRLYGDEGDDDLDGEDGHDKVYGGEGNDLVRGGDGRDKVYGGGGNDHLWGGLGKDKCVGDEGLDLVYGDDGDKVKKGIVVDVEVEYEAVLLGVNGSSATGSASFEFEQEADEVELEFEICIYDAAPNTTYEVIVGGVVVGQIVTDSEGEGELELSNDPDDAGEQLVPANFPSVSAGTRVVVRRVGGAVILDGTFAVEEDN